MPDRGFSELGKYSAVLYNRQRQEFDIVIADLPFTIYPDLDEIFPERFLSLKIIKILDIRNCITTVNG